MHEALHKPKCHATLRNKSSWTVQVNDSAVRLGGYTDGRGVGEWAVGARGAARRGRAGWGEAWVVKGLAKETGMAGWM